MIALFVALGGGAYAAKKLNGKTIANNSIPAKKLKKSVLTGLDKCPSAAPSKTVGICFAASSSAADWDIAARDCAAKGLRLPDLGEGLLVTNAATSPYLWTTDISDTGPPSTRTVVRTEDTGFTRIGTTPKTNATQYRCVINATN